MTLIESAKIMINLILQNVDKEKQEEFELMENETIDICKNINCKDYFDNNLCLSEKLKCKHKIYVKVDLSLCNPTNDNYWYLNFNKPVIENTEHIITNINNKKQLSSFLSNLQSNINNYQKWELDCYHTIKELEQYAKEFCNKLNNDLINCLNSDLLPLRFLEESENFSKSIKTGICTRGYYCWTVLQQEVINIYEVGDRSIDDLKITIRHELIHYYLKKLGLNYNDNSAAFWILAEEYDAHPYMEMTDEEKILYNRIKKIFTIYNTIYNLEKNNTDNKFTPTMPKENQTDLILGVGKYYIDDKVKAEFDNYYNSIIDYINKNNMNIIAS